VTGQASGSAAERQLSAPPQRLTTSSFFDLSSFFKRCATRRCNKHDGGNSLNEQEPIEQKLEIKEWWARRDGAAAAMHSFLADYFLSFDVSTAYCVNQLH